MAKANKNANQTQYVMNNHGLAKKLNKGRPAAVAKADARAAKNRAAKTHGKTMAQVRAWMSEFATALGAADYYDGKRNPETFQSELEACHVDAYPSQGMVKKKIVIIVMDDGPNADGERDALFFSDFKEKGSAKRAADQIAEQVAEWEMYAPEEDEDFEDEGDDE